jgi:hypothetical protein
MTKTKSTAKLAVVRTVKTRHPAIRLHSLDEIRREMASCYRAGKTGAMPTSDAARLVYILSEMVKLWHVKMIEERINNLEGKL